MFNQSNKQRFRVLILVNADTVLPGLMATSAAIIDVTQGAASPHASSVMMS